MRIFSHWKTTLLPLSLHGYRTGDWLVSAGEICVRQLPEVSWRSERPGVGDSFFGFLVWYVLISVWPAVWEDQTCLGTRHWRHRRRGMLSRQIVSGVVTWNFGSAVEPFPCVCGQNLGESVSRCGCQWRAVCPSSCIGFVITLFSFLCLMSRSNLFVCQSDCIIMNTACIVCLV
jgi:hypothetical protein